MPSRALALTLAALVLAIGCGPKRFFTSVPVAKQSDVLAAVHAALLDTFAGPMTPKPWRGRFYVRFEDRPAPAAALRIPGLPPGIELRPGRSLRPTDGNLLRVTSVQFDDDDTVALSMVHGTDVGESSAGCAIFLRRRDNGWLVEDRQCWVS